MKRTLLLAITLTLAFSACAHVRCNLHGEPFCSKGLGSLDCEEAIKACKQ